MARLQLSATSEIDVILKLICSSFKQTAINESDYRTIIPTHIKDFTKIKVELPRYEMEFQPWLSWDSNTTPTWWTAYNKVKHERNAHYEKANLENVLFSMSGLFIANIYHYKDLANAGKLSPWPQLFFPEEKYGNCITPADCGFTLMCNL